MYVRNRGPKRRKGNCSRPCRKLIAHLNVIPGQCSFCFAIEGLRHKVRDAMQLRHVVLLLLEEIWIFGHGPQYFFFTNIFSDMWLILDIYRFLGKILIPLLPGLYIPISFMKINSLVSLRLALLSFLVYYFTFSWE